MNRTPGNAELSLWAIIMLITWCLFAAIVFADFLASVVPIFETGTRNDVAGDLKASIVLLILFIPPFVITEEVESCRTIYATNLFLRPLYAFTLAFLAVVALIQFSFLIFDSRIAALVALVVGRAAMCFFFHKFPMDKINV